MTPSPLYFELSWTGAPRNLAVTLTKRKSGHDVYIREVNLGIGRWLTVWKEESTDELVCRVAAALLEVLGREVTLEIKPAPKLWQMT